MTFEAIAVTGWQSLTMTNNNPVAKAVLQDVSQKNPIFLNKLAITQAKPEMWSSSCLGLAQEGEAIVAGWRVFVSRQDRLWIEP